MKQTKQRVVMNAPNKVRVSQSEMTRTASSGQFHRQTYVGNIMGTQEGSWNGWKLTTVKYHTYGALLPSRDAFRSTRASIVSARHGEQRLLCT